MVRSYINNEIEIKRFKNHIIEANKLIDYHNEKIKIFENTIRVYNEIINNLEDHRNL